MQEAHCGRRDDWESKSQMPRQRQGANALLKILSPTLSAYNNQVMVYCLLNNHSAEIF